MAEVIIAVADADYVGIVAEDIMIIEIMLLDIEQADTEAALVQLASSHHSSSSRYPPYFLAAAEVLFNISHRVLLIYKIYSID